jgi:hypothetical protein
LMVVNIVPWCVALNSDVGGGRPRVHGLEI